MNYIEHAHWFWGWCKEVEECSDLENSIQNYLERLEWWLDSGRIRLFCWIASSETEKSHSSQMYS